MENVTQILNAVQAGDRRAAEQILPLVYDELRRLAAAKIALEKPGQTLDATALVHEAYLRLAGGSGPQSWNHRGHFYAAAAEAMRRILVENARRKRTRKRAGGWQRHALTETQLATADTSIDLLALDEALDQLASLDPVAAQVVKFRYFSGLTIAQAAEALEISPRSADRLWAFARAWLFRALAAP